VYSSCSEQRSEDMPANEIARATENVFQYNMNAMCIQSGTLKKKPEDAIKQKDKRTYQTSAPLRKSDRKLQETVRIKEVDVQKASEAKNNQQAIELKPQVVVECLTEDSEKKHEDTTSQQLDSITTAKELEPTLKTERTSSTTEQFNTEHKENPKTENNVLARDTMYTENLPFKLNSDTQRSIPKNTEILRRETKLEQPLFKGTEARVKKVAWPSGQALSEPLRSS
jgi:hypothetical protein